MSDCGSSNKTYSKKHGDTKGSDCHPQKNAFDKLLWISATFVAVFYLLHWLARDHISSLPYIPVMAHTAFEMMNTMWWGIVIGFFMVGLLSVVPRQYVMSILGQGKDFKGIVRASAAGVLLDLCSHGILMVAAKLYERGASAGQVMAFLLASPWNSFSLTLILWALIGFKLTVLFIILSMLIAITTGVIFNVLVAKGMLPDNPNCHEFDEHFKFWENAKQSLKQVDYDRALFKQILFSGVSESRMVLRWLFFGVVLASVLRAVIPLESFEQYFGATTLGLFMTIIFATLLEVCSEGSTPIAADIINRAAAPGNGFAFLMAGVSTDYTEIMVIKDTTKSWKLALFIPLISLPQVVLIAWLLNIA